MNPTLADIDTMLTEWSVTHNADTRQWINNAVQTYTDVTGAFLPADYQARVDAMNGADTGTVGGGILPQTVPAPAPGAPAPSMFSAKGIRLGNVLLPWAGVAAVVLFGYVAWHVSKKRRRA